MTGGKIMKLIKKLWIGIAALVVLSPLGLIIPEHFKAVGAWGEWGAGEMQKMVGYVPQGLKKLSSLWNAPIPDYTFKGFEKKSLAQISFGYILSALAGISIVAAVMFIVGKLFAKKEE